MQTRFTHIDGLRAIAVLTVMFFHARVHAPGIALDPMAKEGSHGVDLFFVLSGFCLAAPTLEKLRKTGEANFDVLGFAIKRVLRIFPPYAFAVGIIATLGWIAVSHGFALPPSMPHAFTPVDVVSDLLFLDRDTQHINASFWSLAVEARWYVVFPFALVLAVRNVRAFVALTAFVVFCSELTRATSTDLGVLPAFLFGIAAAYVRAFNIKVARYAIPLGILSVVLAIVNEQRPHFPIQTNVGWHLAAFFFVVFVNQSERAQRLLSSKWLVRIGIASYSIYLLHEPIVSEIMLRLRPSLGDVAATAVALGAGLTAGFALWALVERPLTKPAFVTAVVLRARAGAGELAAFAGIPALVALRVATVPTSFVVPEPATNVRSIVRPKFVEVVERERQAV